MATAALHETWENTVSRDMAIGRQVGDYVIRRRIGSGGMGIVYEAEHPVIGRRVAIKILRPDKVGSRDLLGEAQAASSIRHRHIIDIYGFGELPGLGQYLVMDFLEGIGLDGEIRARAPLPAADVISILDDTAAALSAAHAKGIVHRDLKPGNLFLVRESNGTRYVKVLDFGLAKSTHAVDEPAARKLTAEGTTLGTPDYIAPEQARGKKLDGRADLYSLGVIAFEMLTGRVPFIEASPFEVAVAHVQKRPPTLRSVEPSVPDELETLVLKLLEKNPADRPPSADALREQLSRVQQLIGLSKTQVAIMAPPGDDAPASVETLPVQQGPARWPMLVAVGVVCAGAAVALTLALRPEPLPAPAPVAGLAVAPVPPTPPEPKAHEAELLDDDETGPLPLPVSPGARRVRPKPAPAAVPVRQPGMLEVVTRGCSMELTLDGQTKGHTPLTAFSLAAGTHRLKLGNPWCKPAVVEQDVVVHPGQTAKVELTFEKLK